MLSGNDLAEAGNERHMERFLRLAAQFLRDERAQDTVEYALVVMCLALAGIAMMKGLATNVGNFFQVLDNTLANAS